MTWVALISNTVPRDTVSAYPVQVAFRQVFCNMVRILSEKELRRTILSFGAIISSWRRLCV